MSHTQSPHQLNAYIDTIFGREYDPYPASRSRQETWLSSPLSPGPPGATPRITTTSPMGYGVPDVHRVERDVDSGFGEQPGQASARSPLSPHSFTSLRPPLPGGSLFKEMDQPVPTQFTSPTNVSYPTTSWVSVPQHSMRAETLSNFQPRQASTPAPTPGRREDYRNGTPRYGAPYDDSFGRSGEVDHNAEHGYDEQEEDHGYDQNLDRDRELDSPEPMSVMLDETPEDVVQTATPQMHQEYEANPTKAKGKSKGFVGGFVAGLRHMPRMMSRGHTKAQPPPADVPNTPFAPQFQSSQQQPYSQTPPRLQHPLRSQQSLGLRQTPYSQQPAYSQQPTHSQRSLHSEPQAEDPHPDSRYDVSGQTESLEPRHSNLIPQYAQEDSTLSSQTTSTSRTGPITPAEHTTDGPLDLPNPYDLPPIRTSSSIHDSPIQAELQPAADYSAMLPIIHDDGPETTFGSHINRVGKFFSDLTHLPWVAPPTHVAAVYAPAESRRARYADKKPGQSWYTKENHEKLDLLATGSPRPRRMPVQQPQASTRPGPSQTRHDRDRQQTARGSPRSRDAATAVRPTHTPGSITSRGMDEPVSPGASSHGQGHHSYSYCYQCAAPQVMYMYPATSPLRPGASELPGVHLPGPGEADPQRAMPMYVLAAPGPMMMPASPGGHHHDHRHHTRQPTMPFSFPMPVMPVQISPSNSRSPQAQMLSPPRSPVQPLSPRKSPRVDRRSPLQQQSQSQPQPTSSSSSPGKTRTPL